MGLPLGAAETPTLTLGRIRYSIVSPLGRRWNTPLLDAERSCVGTAAKRQLEEGVPDPL